MRKYITLIRIRLKLPVPMGMKSLRYIQHSSLVAMASEAFRVRRFPPLKRMNMSGFIHLAGWVFYLKPNLLTMNLFTRVTKMVFRFVQ